MLPARTTRKLRAHQKSRQGCGNCKLRKVKCDEGKPECGQCRAYNVMCAYDTAGPRLQSSFIGINKMDIFFVQNYPSIGNEDVIKSPSIPSTLPFPVLIGGIQGIQDLGLRNLSLLHKFQERTNETIGMGQHKKNYPHLYIELSLAHPFLLHIILTLTIMHDRYLGIDSSTQQDMAMAFHWSQGAAMLNDKITNGVKQSEKDALWASAVLLATLAFASIEAKTPEETWPLKPSLENDLDWLKLIEGKKEIWKIADPHRTDSVFYPRIPKFEFHVREFIALEADLSGLPFELITLCGIYDTSSTQNNPYLRLVSTLANLTSIACTHDTFGQYIGFFGTMDLKFKQLLARKDPAALLVLAFWYARVCHLKQWWLWRRATLECTGICRYLRLFYAYNSTVMSLVLVLEALLDQAASVV